jgi:hypothetical protein
MKPLLGAVLAGVVLTAARGDMVPSDPQTPLFEIYEMKTLPHKGSDPHTHQAETGNLLLRVFTLRDLLPLPDGAQITLTEKDARAFARLTRSHDYLILLTPRSDTGVVMHISAPIEDGVIMFTPRNFSTQVARYIRQRFGQ